MKKIAMIVLALFALPAFAACADNDPPSTGGGEPAQVDCEIVEGVVTLTFPNGTVLPRPNMEACP